MESWRKAKTYRGSNGKRGQVCADECGSEKPKGLTAKVVESAKGRANRVFARKFFRENF
jgi:hypothetical protein